MLPLLKKIWLNVSMFSDILHLYIEPHKDFCEFINILCLRH